MLPLAKSGMKALRLTRTYKERKIIHVLGGFPDGILSRIQGLFSAGSWDRCLYCLWVSRRRGLVNACGATSRGVLSCVSPVTNCPVVCSLVWLWYLVSVTVQSRNHAVLTC